MNILLHLGGAGGYNKGPIRFTPADFTAYQNGTKVASDWNGAILYEVLPHNSNMILVLLVVTKIPAIMQVWVF